MTKINKPMIESHSAARIATKIGQESNSNSHRDSQCDSWSAWYDEICSAPFATESPIAVSSVSSEPTAASNSVFKSPAASSIRSETVCESQEFSPPKDIEQTHLVLMARDPYSAYAYWNVPDTQHSASEPPLILRLYQEVIPNATEEPASTMPADDIPAVPCASQYFEQLSANAHYYAELGAVQDEGNFIVVASSNTVVTPPDGCVPTTITQPFQAEVPENEFRSFGVTEGEVRAYYRDLMSRVNLPRRKRIPYDTQASLLLCMPKTENAPALAYGESSWLLGANENLNHDDPAALFAQIDVEVVVFGRVQPGARLILEEANVPLRADGTFSMRLAIPPGGLRLPFVARARERARRIAVTVDYTKHDCSVLLSGRDEDVCVSEDSLDLLAADSSGEISS